MTHYRYRTGVLVGRWLRSRRFAHADALRAGQAMWDEKTKSLRWLVPGSIEEEAESRQEAA